MRDSGGGAEDREKIELNTLHTLQEIADYLRVVIRAAQIYERDHELPVHRLLKTGRRVKARNRELSDLYDVNSFAIVPSRERTPLVAFSANHASVYPNQVGALNGKTGKLEREYWHSGHLLRLSVHEWDNDGEPEIILTGANVGGACATLIMLDPLRMAGASVQPEDDPTQLEGFAPGVEKAVVRFPHSCIARRSGRTNRAARFSVLPGALEVVVFDRNVELGTHLVYSLDRNLDVVHVDPSPDFIARHHKRQKDGRLDHEYSPNELQELGRQVTVTRGR